MSDRQVKCPQCGKSIVWKQHPKTRPFCSERCQLIDLGAWADEQHKIPGEKTTEWRRDH